MKIKQSILISAVLVLGLNYSATAEMRIWTDQNGKTIEAEHIRTMDDKVILKMADEVEIKVSLDTLTEKDRKYAILMAPPRVEINVATQTDRDNKAVGPDSRGPGFQVQKETVQLTVKVNKTSPAPYEAPMVSEVYLVGEPEQAEFYVVLDTTKSKFKFTTENKNEHSYQSGTINLKQLEAGKQKGIEYKGYIAIVRDRTGEIIGMKCSKLTFEKNADAIIGSKKGSVFDADFNPVEVEDVRKAVTAETDKMMKKKVPGRRF